MFASRALSLSLVRVRVGSCVYIGADFLYDNIIDALLSRGLQSSLASWAVLGVCLSVDMLWGVLLGVAAFQLHAAYEARAAKSGAPADGSVRKSPRLAKKTQ